MLQPCRLATRSSSVSSLVRFRPELLPPAAARLDRAQLGSPYPETCSFPQVYCTKNQKYHVQQCNYDRGDESPFVPVFEGEEGIVFVPVSL